MKNPEDRYAVEWVALGQTVKVCRDRIAWWVGDKADNEKEIRKAKTRARKIASNVAQAYVGRELGGLKVVRSSAGTMFSEDGTTMEAAALLGRWKS